MKARFIILTLFVLSFCNLLLAQVSADAGKAIFTARCNACHGIGKQVVGPDLKDVENIRSEEWIINFVHSSQTVIKSGDTAAVALFSEFNKTIMPDHSDLSNGDIKNIIAYIKQESENVAKNAGPNLKIDKMPYQNTDESILHRIIFLDLPGNHVPLQLTDYVAWLAIGVAIIFLIVALITKVRFEDSKDHDGK
ncbi:MAG: cytochrome c [Arachidicoccus sp.]|nr:cytochrome c [Arachidicoccus sp.]